MNAQTLLFRLKNILLPLLMIFGLVGFSGSSFAAYKEEHHKAVVHKKKAYHHEQGAAKHKKAAKVHKKAAEHHKKEAKHHMHKAVHEKKAKHHHKAEKHKAEMRKKARVIGHRDDGRPIYEGPQGGHYYINDAGNKVYLPKE